MVKAAALAAAALLSSALPGAAQEKTAAMLRQDIGRPITGPIARDGEPQSVGRISPLLLAYTFVRRANRPPPIRRPASRDPHEVPLIGPRPLPQTCRYTLIVAASDSIPLSDRLVVDYWPPTEACE